MRAIVIIPDEQSGTLELRDLSDPTPGPLDLLRRVEATALNRADLAQRRGRYPAAVTAADSGLAIGGLEAAGEENLGPGRAYLVGDATLDGNVDGADFLSWNGNKFTSSDVSSVMEPVRIKGRNVNVATMALGKTCLTMMRRLLAPSARAAVTY